MESRAGRDRVLLDSGGPASVGSGRFAGGWRPLRQGPTGAPTPRGAVCWSPPSLALARRTRQPPLAPRRAGRRGRAPVTGWPSGIVDLAGRPISGRPPVRGTGGGGWHGEWRGEPGVSPPGGSRRCPSAKKVEFHKLLRMILMEVNE